MNQKQFAYFGYGSLVNRQTRAAQSSAIPIHITGWRRQWKHCVAPPYGKICALTAVMSPTATIDGVLVLENIDNLDALDGREIGYQRQPIDLHTPDVPKGLVGIRTFIYVSKQEHNRWRSAEYPIWRSYLDSVLAGYFELWGAEGVVRFIATTDGWESPVLDDRLDPKYPRATRLDACTRQVIAELLQQSGVLPRRLLPAS